MKFNTEIKTISALSYCLFKILATHCLITQQLTSIQMVSGAVLTSLKLTTFTDNCKRPHCLPYSAYYIAADKFAKIDQSHSMKVCDLEEVLFDNRFRLEMHPANRVVPWDL